MIYKAEYHPKVKKDLKKIDPPIREKIRSEHIPKILANPEIGEELTGDLNGTRSYHFTVSKQQVRIAYFVEEEAKKIFVQMIGKRGNFYTLLKKRGILY
ncbi:MAG: type II toxin-antitoxin system mRNA interferase toxin, RelE/StbE family [Deltaproteobacteria bacterium]|nr:type II toxin-antitoxin system mRNA interferase toxin, RelE/StbE family [Deltaproteobacteria bacterium]